MIQLRTATLALLLSLAACGGDPTPVPESDAGVLEDAGLIDDAGLEEDAGIEQPDAGAPSDAGLSSDAGRIPPDTRIESAPPAFSRSRTAEFTFSATTADATWECALDGELFTPCTSPAHYDALAEGRHRFSVRAIGVNGLADPAPALHNWTVDTTAPSSWFKSTPTSEGASEPAAFVFTANEEGSSFECALDGAPFAACSSPSLRVDLAEGTHAFEVRATDRAGNVEGQPERHTWTVTAGSPVTVRMAGANITSGTLQSYTPGHGIRIFQALAPDIALLQELNYKTNSAADLREFVDTAFGEGYAFTRESGVQIPNGIVSRFPILESGVWDDPHVNNREFVWARIDVPGPKDLWAVSLHLLTSNPTQRNAEATSLIGYLQANVPAGDYLVLGGDLNTRNRTEACLQTLAQVVVTSGPWPADQQGNGNTSGQRDAPYDWLMPDVDLAALETPLKLGTSTFPNGIVFDSRVYTPLSEVPPVEPGDSGAEGMQHMLVGKDFVFTP